MYSLTAFVPSEDRARNIARTLVDNDVTDNVAVTKIEHTYKSLNNRIITDKNHFKVDALLRTDKNKTEQLRRLYSEIIIVELQEVIQ